MRDGVTRHDKSAEELLVDEVADEALENAASMGSQKVGNYTLFYCTALDLCPGP